MIKGKMHSLLGRQLKRCFGESFTIPPEWEPFIESVNSAYKENDIDRGMLERSLELSSHELMQANSETQALISAFPDIQFRLSSDGTILDYKAGICADLLLQETYRGKRIQDVSVKEAAGKFNQAIKEVNETRTLTCIEYSLAIKGREEYFEARFVPLLDDQVFTIIRNVTRLREAENELRKLTVELESIVAERTRELTAANERLRELDNLKTEFFSSASHELRTPLTSVIGFMHIIERRLSKSIFPMIESDCKKVHKAMHQVKTDIDIILSEGARLISLINDVLDIAKMEAGKMEWKREMINVNELLRNAVAATTPLFRRKKVSVVLDFFADELYVLGDWDRLMQVMINLISNAAKFTEHGEVRISSGMAEDGVEIRVADTGIGMSSTSQGKIFEKFIQIMDSVSDKPRGTGLGLPICKHIIERHDGRIWVESEPGKGSTFTFILPYPEAAVRFGT